MSRILEAYCEYHIKSVVLKIIMDPSGFEPLTSALQMRRETMGARGLGVALLWPEIVIELASWHKVMTAGSELASH